VNKENESGGVDEELFVASEEQAKEFANELGIPFIETSAKSAKNVEEAFLTMGTHSTAKSIKRSSRKSKGKERNYLATAVGNDSSNCCRRKRTRSVQMQTLSFVCLCLQVVLHSTVEEENSP
jgi:hypothetical protein